MEKSRNSVAPMYAMVIPWPSIQPPYSPVAIQAQGSRQNSNIRPKHTKDTTYCFVSTCLGGIIIIVLFGISTTIPFFIIPVSSSENLPTIVTNTTSSTTTTVTTTMPSLRWNSTGETIAGQPNATSATIYNLKNPIGIVIAPSNKLYVADSSNNRVQQFFLDNNNGTTVAGSPNGTYGSTPYRCNSPNDVTVDANGNLYVVDSDNHRVQLWRVNSTSGITIAGNGIAGNSSNQLSFPTGIAFDSNPDIFYISDGDNHRVMRYTLNSTVGTLVAGGNGPGKNNTRLYSPRGLYYESSTNSLIIANYEAHNIVRWIIGASSWTIVAGNSNGSFGSGPSALYYPWDVILDYMGNVYVADRANHRIQFFLAGERNATTIAGIKGQSGNNSTLLNRPLSIALDSQLNLYVADSYNNRIQKFLRY